MTPETVAMHAGGVFSALYAIRKFMPTLWSKLPHKYDWLWPIIGAGVDAIAQNFALGMPLKDAAMLWAGSALSAAGAHKLGSDSPLPYDNGDAS